MKSTFKVVIAALVLSTFVFEGCKKGANDPFISLSSRKARVSGDWTVSAGSGSYGSSAATTTWTFNGTVYSETDANGTTTANQTITMNFEKDGTYKTVNTVTDASISYTDVTTETGTWNFTGKIGDDKNKDHIVMKTLVSTEVQTVGSASTTSTDTYTGDDAPTNIMYIDQLKGKEMIFTYDGTYVNGTNNSFSKGSWTLTPQ